MIASLNSARERARIVSIKISLKNAMTHGQRFFMDHGSYYINTSTQVCNNSTGDSPIPEIQLAIDSIRDMGALVMCRSTLGALNRVDFSIVVIYKENNFIVADPFGVMQLDKNNISSTTMSWNDAMSSCISQGKRMPGLSSFVSFWVLYGGNPGFDSNSYWTINEDPSDNTKAYVFNNGSAQIPLKTGNGNVLCGS